MLNLGIIGTNWIAAQFVNAGAENSVFTLTAVYSRTAEKAQKFAESVARPEAKFFTDLEEFFASDAFDVVYIASPNSLHKEQAVQAINAGKHVIVEKPAVSNPSEFKEVKAALAENDEVFFFEAARHIFDPNFKVLENKLAELQETGRVNGATISYMKYSSRYDKVLAGEEPNIFSPKFSGGALQDLGVYVVYGALRLFGTPEKVHYFADMTSTGVDAKGTAILDYPNFHVTLLFGKTAQSYVPTEIYAGKQTLWVDSIATLDEVKFYPDYSSSDFEDLTVAHPENPMVDEADFFAKAIETGDFDAMQELLVLSHNVNEVLFALRKNAGIEFAADRG